MGEASDDDEVRQRIRDAILKAGGVPQTSARTGIPAKTLENYLAKRSTPSLDRAAKIAAAAGMRVGELAGEPSTVDPTAGSVTPTSHVKLEAVGPMLKMIGDVVVHVYRDEDARIPNVALVSEIARFYTMMVDEFGAVDEATTRDLLPKLEKRLREEIREAAAAPGTGKRSAS